MTIQSATATLVPAQPLTTPAIPEAAVNYPRRQLLRLATAGSVDDGKSTLIGRLLHDTGSLPLDHLESVTDAEGVADLAALSDGLRAEREQGITIDVAYRFFATSTRSYILADTPGHESYTRNMFTGASTAHVAVLLVDARAGVLRQTRRHARIAQLVGVRHLVAAVNKIDLVGYGQARLEEVSAEIAALAARLGVTIDVIPLAARDGDNVVHRSANTPWYTGPTLLEYLENIDIVAHHAHPHELRLPIQWASRPTGTERRRYTGRLAAGTLTAGDPVTVLPAGIRTTVTELDTLDENRTTAVAPLSVSVELDGDIDAGRGALLVGGHDAALPVQARELDTTVCWFADRPLRAGDRYALKQATATVRATVQALHSQLDPETLHDYDNPAELRLNDIGAVTVRTSAVVFADNYADNRITGAFILIDEHTNDTVGAGTITAARELPLAGANDAAVQWHPTPLVRQQRWSALGQRGAIIWLTGPPAAEGSSVGAAVERALVAAGRPAYLLDGANLHHGLAGDLGTAAGDKAETIRRTGHLARLFADAGVVAIAVTESGAEIARALSAAAGLPFLQVHLGSSAGAPAHPDLVLDAASADPETLAVRVLSSLAEHEARP